VKATAAAVGAPTTWNGRTLKWLGILLVLLVGCGLSSYYVHLYGEQDEDDQDQDQTASSMVVRPAPRSAFPAAAGRSCRIRLTHVSETEPAEAPRHSGGPSPDTRSRLR
jgi:hypothetical protein